MEKSETSIKINSIGKTVTFRMKGISYTLSDNDIVKAAKSLKSPDTIRDYFVKLMDSEGEIKEFSIKQVVREALRTEYGDSFSEDYFTSQRARHVLTKLNFTINTKT